MYKKFYNLQDNPFRLTPDPQFLCMTAQHREALCGLIYSICAGPGLTLLTGEAGTGKTTLVYVLLALLKKKNFSVALCTNPMLSREEFYDFLLASLGVECASTLKSRQLIALQEHLLKNRSQGRPSLLVVDEAQRFSLELLEEARLLLNLETPREKLLQIILAGQPEMEELLRRPEMRHLKQRVSYVCRLAPLSRDQLQEYLGHRLSRAGLPNQTLFSAAAIQAIYYFTDGLPRLVNTLCDHALQTGFALQSPHITISIIEEAAADLDLLTALNFRERGSQGDEPEPVAVLAGSAPTVAVHGTNGSQEASRQETQLGRIPLESYASRQKSLGFMAGLLDRWGLARTEPFRETK